jgi:hypothetical protein
MFLASKKGTGFGNLKGNKIYSEVRIGTESRKGRTKEEVSRGLQERKTRSRDPFDKEEG